MHRLHDCRDLVTLNFHGARSCDGAGHVYQVNEPLQHVGRGHRHTQSPTVCQARAECVGSRGHRAGSSVVLLTDEVSGNLGLWCCVALKEPLLGQP